MDKKKWTFILSNLNEAIEIENRKSEALERLFRKK